MKISFYSWSVFSSFQLSLYIDSLFTHLGFPSYYSPDYSISALASSAIMIQKTCVQKTLDQLQNLLPLLTQTPSNFISDDPSNFTNTKTFVSQNSSKFKTDTKKPADRLEYQLDVTTQYHQQELIKWWIPNSDVSFREFDLVT